MSISFSSRKGVDTEATIPVRDDLAGYTNLKIELSSNSRFGGIPDYTTVIPAGSRAVQVALPKEFTDVFRDGYFRIVGTKGGVVRILQTGVIDFAEEGPKPGLSATAEASIKELIGAGGGGGGGGATVYNSKLFTINADILSTDTAATNPNLVVTVNWDNPTPTLDYDVKLDWPVVKSLERHWIEIPPLTAGTSTNNMITWKRSPGGTSYVPNVMPQGEKFPGKISFDYKTTSEASATCLNDTAVDTVKSYYAEVWLEVVHLETPLGLVILDSQNVIDNNTVELTLRVLPKFGGGLSTVPAGTRLLATALSPKYTPAP